MIFVDHKEKIVMNYVLLKDKFSDFMCFVLKTG
jgi:hypothetical protein